MKSQTRFLVVLLAIALAISCFAVMAFAEGENYSHLDMLEYYEAGYYLNEQFDSAEGLFGDKSDELVLSEGGYNCTVSNGKGTFSGSAFANIFTVVPGDATGFGLNLGGKNVAGGRGAAVRLQLVKDQANFDTLDVFTISNGSLECANNPNPINNTAFNDGEDFTLEFFYDGETANLKVNGVDYDVNLESYAYSEIKLIFFSAEFDYIEMYKGTFSRRLANLEDTIVDKILDIKNGDQSEAALEAVAKVYGLYGFDSAKVTDSAKAAEAEEFAITALQTYGNSVASKFVSGADAITATEDYATIAGLVEELTKYDTVLANIENKFASDVVIDVENDVIAEKRVILSDAKDWLVAQKENTISSIALLDEAPDLFSATYKQLYTFYESYKLAPICGTYSDDEYAADFVKECFNKAELLKNEFLRVDGRAKAFSENVPISVNTSLTFGERYVAYSVAKENVFNDSTYDEFLTDVTIAELNVMYGEAASALAEKAAYADEFLAKMSEASSTLSYSVMQSTLDAAEAYLDDVEPTYPGVAEAKQLYTNLRNKISEAKTAAEEYIKAVIAVQEAKTIADKKAAIAIAKEKGVLGSDVSLEVSVGDITVSDANVILSNEESAIDLEKVKNGNFINAVSAIDDEVDLSERRLAILYAVNLRADADENNQEVKDAIFALETAMDEYDAAVNAANKQAKECNDTVAATVEKTVLTKVAADVVAIIKKFFD